MQQGLIVGIFIADKWPQATTQNFPGTLADRPGRWEFVGRDATEEIANLYIRRRVPDAMRKPGAANPVRYVV